MSNICKERYGCNGACCYAPTLTFSQESQRQAFLDAARQASAELDFTSKEGFLAAKALASPRTSPLLVIHPSEPKIQISGPCPFLCHGECSIFNETYRPQACKNFQPKSDECHQARKHFNLPPLKL